MIHLPLVLVTAALLSPAHPADVRIEGLQPGESATRLAPGPDPHPAEDYAHGRVVDAFTAEPVAGATVELWSEEIDDHYGGFHRFGSATTGIDGRFAVRRRDGARTADKLRVAAPGYLVFTEAAGMANEVITLFPAEATAPRIRFEDLQGRPIEGARVTSTYTCAHDIPAFAYTSDVDGVVVLEGYGLQDAIPELRVLAPGFRGIKYLDGDAVLMAAARGEAYTQRLRRTPGASGALLDTDGTPIADTLLNVLDGDGFHVVRTNAEGRFAIPARYDDGELLMRLMPDDGRGAAYGVAGGNDVFRRGGDDLPEGVPTGRLRLVLEGAPEGASTQGLEVRTSGGWSDTADEDGWVELPVPSDDPGRTVSVSLVNPDGTLLGVTAEGAVFLRKDGPSVQSTLGSANSMTVQLPMVLLITPGEDREVSVPWSLGKRAARLPAGVADAVVVEQGSRSVVYHANDDGTLDAWLWSDGPFTLWFPQSDVVARYAETPDEHELQRWIGRLEAARAATSEPGALAETRLRVPAETEVAADSPSAEGLDLAIDGDEVTVSGPRGPVLLRFSRDGHATRWARALLGVSAGVSASKLPALASLTVTDADGTKLAVEGFDDPGDLTRLHPGRFDCVVHLADGRRVALRLELRPGDARELRVQ